MSSQRATPTAGSSRGQLSSSSPTAAAGRSSSLSRSPSTPQKDASRGAASAASSGFSRPSIYAPTTSSRNAAAATAAASGELEGGPELVAQLQERLQQLDAETKASQDTAQWTIKQNKNTLLALKQENKDLCAEVARRGGSTELQGKTGTATDGERVVERLERQVHELRRAYDKVVKDKKTALQKLDNLHDSLRDMAKVAAAVPTACAAAASVSSHPLTASLGSAASVSALAASAPTLPPSGVAARELRQLQNRLDKATVKANEAFSIRKTYEGVLEKLRVEEPLLEARIRGLEEQRAIKQAAVQTALLTGREVQNAKEAAKAAMAAGEGEVAANRTRRARVLAEMREKAATLQQTNRALMQRQFVPLVPPTPSESVLSTTASATSPGAGTATGTGTAAAGAKNSTASLPTTPAASAGANGGSGDSSARETDDPRVTESRSAAAAAAAPEDSTAQLHKSEMYDITARDLIIKLCRLTACRRVSELVSRLLAQQESFARLAEMQSQATAQRLALVQELEVLRWHRDELRGGGKLSTQKQMDAAQEELLDATSRADTSSTALEALLRSHAELRGGLEHLAAMVAPLPLPPGGPPAVPLEDDTMGDVLAQIEQRLVGSYRVIAALPKAVELLESTYVSLKQG